MNKLLYLIIFICSLLSASDDIWSTNTEAISQEEYKNALQEYNSKIDSKIDFKDDRGEETLRYGYKKSVFVIGLGVGSIKYDEKTQDNFSEQKNAYTSSRVKLSIGKDFTFFHEEYTQPTRIFFTYTFEKLDNEQDFSIWSLGIRENMSYWPLYTGKSSKLYPTASLEIGKATLAKKYYDTSGLTSQINLGVTYAYKDNFEYFLNLSYDYTALVNKLYDNNTDKMSGYGLNAGITYKFLYDD